MKAGQTLRKYTQGLRSELPLNKYAVHVSYRKLKRNSGVCLGPYKRKDGREYLQIVIDSGLKDGAKLDVLMHEYAHAILIDKDILFTDEMTDHGREWGVVYSKVYKTFLKLSQLLEAE